MVEVIGSGAGGLQGGAAGKEGHLEGGSPGLQGGGGLTRHRPSRFGRKVSDGDYKSPVHSLHFLLQRLPWFQSGSRHRYPFLRG